MKINMIRLKIVLFVFTLIFTSGCNSDDGEKGDYSTVSNMIAERNKARFKVAAARKSHSPNIDKASTPEEIPKEETKEKKLAEMTFEENVVIVSESTGKPIARGTAYLDKTGKIINIRISNK